MKSIRLMVAAIFVAGLGACEIVKTEAGYPGGNIGRLADKNFYVARDYNERIHRYILGLAFIAPLSAATAQTPEDAASSARYIAAVYEQVTLLQETLKGDCSPFSKRFAADLDAAKSTPAVSDASITPPVGADGAESVKDTTKMRIKARHCQDYNKSTATIFAFESHEFRVQRSLFNLTQQAADNLDLKSRLSSVSGLDSFQLLQLVLKTRKLVPVLMRYIATYRDLSVIFIDVVATACTDPENTRCKALRGSLENNFHIKGPISFDGETPYRPLADALDQAKKIANEPGVTIRLDKSHIAALVYHIDAACRELVLRQQFSGEEKNAANCGADFKVADKKLASPKARDNFITEFIGQ